jgi:hypothetical protein
MSELIFNAFRRPRQLHTLWLIWSSLCFAADDNDPAHTGLSPSALRHSVGLSAVTWRKAVRILTKLGLVVPYRAHPWTEYHLVLVRGTLPARVAELLRAVASGAVEVHFGKTLVRERSTGREIDLTPSGALAEELASQVDRRSGVALLPQLSGVSNSS